MEDKRTEQENAYESAFMKRHGENGRAEYEKRMQNEWCRKSFAFYDADGNLHTIDFAGREAWRCVMLDGRYTLVEMKNADNDWKIRRIESRLWITVGILSVSVLALGVTILLHIL